MRKIYQFYIEYFFLLNFVYMLCIWELTDIFLSCTVTQKRIIAVSFLGTLVSCICLFLPFVMWLRLMLGTFVAGASGIVLLLPKKTKMRGYIKGLVVATETAILLGGSIALLQKLILKREFSVWLIVLSAVIITLILRILLPLFCVSKQELFYSVVLYCEGKEYPMKAMVDTGNGLIEPISRKAVCLVGKEFFERQWEKEGERIGFQPQKFRIIPYHAVGTDSGLLSGYEMDRLIIFTDERKVEIQKPMIGISDTAIGSMSTYQMILQPELLSEGVS